MTRGWTDEQMARRVADDLGAVNVVNLGIGLPTLVARPLHETGVLVHSENGIVGVGPPAAQGAEDWDLVDAGKNPVTLATGAAILDHVDSFALIRGGRLDATVLGAFQVSLDGDLAGWMIPDQRTGSVGGSMDLAVGARQVLVLMRHFDKLGRPKLVAKCTYPLTARGCVSRVYTELAVIDLTGKSAVVVELAPGIVETDLALPQRTRPSQ